MYNKKVKIKGLFYKKSQILVMTLFFLFSSFLLVSQTMYGIKKTVEIPFEYSNDFIIITIQFNKILPLRFIFDTGAEHTVLLKREIAEVLGIPSERRIRIVGSDMQSDRYANLIRRVHLRIADINLPNQSLLVLEEDYFNFEENIGMDIQGILGAEIFRAYRVAINYEDKVITLSPSSEKNKINKSYRKMPSEVYKNKIYLKSDLTLSDSVKIPVKLLVDTGAGLSLLLHTNTHSELELPEQVVTGQLGMGLGGFLEGFLGRVKKLSLNENDLELNEILTKFQEISPELDTTSLNQRNGLIGNQALRRFDVIIDYPHGELYLRPSKYYKKKFEFDKSGIVLIAGGALLNEFYVNKVLSNSPAAEMGLLKGDRLLSLNGVPVGLIGFDTILNKLKKKAGKRVKLVVKRGETKLKITLILRDLI